MTYREAIKHLNISEARFKMLLRLCVHVKRTRGVPYDYDGYILSLFERYLRTQKEFLAVKEEMGGGKAIQRNESKYARG